MDPNEVIDQATTSSSGSKPTWGDATAEIIIPNGAYHVRIKKAKYVEPKPEKVAAAQARGDEAYPYTAVQLVIQEEGPLYGQIIFENLTHRPGFAFLVRQLAEKAGLDLNEIAGEEYNPQLFVDREVICAGEIVKPTEEQIKQGYTQPRFRTKRFLALDEVEG